MEKGFGETRRSSDEQNGPEKFAWIQGFNLKMAIF